MSVKFKTDRRNFLKVSGAALVATQVPGIGEAKTAPKEYWNLSDEWPFTDNKYHGVALSYLPVRRYVAFFAKQRWSNFPLPKVGTVVGSKDGKLLFTIAHDSISYFVEKAVHIDNGGRFYSPGQPELGPLYSSVIVEVEAVAPGNEYAQGNCRITKLFTPNTPFEYVRGVTGSLPECLFVTNAFVKNVIGEEKVRGS